MNVSVSKKIQEVAVKWEGEKKEKEKGPKKKKKKKIVP